MLSRRMIFAMLLLSALAARPAPAAESAENGRGMTVVARPLSVDQIRAEGFDAAQSAGLFVGVRVFVDEDGMPTTKVAEIPYAADDAVDLAHLFALNLGLIDPKNVILAISGEPRGEASRAKLKALMEAGATRAAPTYTNIFKLLDRVRSRSGKKGMVVVTFATHGYQLPGTTEQRLFGQDSTRGDLEYTGVPISRILAKVEACDAPRRLVFLDACREQVDGARLAVGSDPRAAMSRDFADAIAKARGTVVLQATTPGGYSYDDPAAENGVFTEAIITGLKGGAEADERGYITPSTLVKYTDAAVRDWVAKNKPEHATRSRGISYKLEEAAAAQMPLSVNPRALERYQAAASRREKLISSLKRLQDRPTISGAMVDEITEALEKASDEKAAPLLMQMQILENMGPPYRAEFARWWTIIGKRDFGIAVTPAPAIAPQPTTTTLTTPQAPPSAVSRDWHLEVLNSYPELTKFLDGKGNVTICHIPPGNKDNPQTITISPSAWPAHKEHGDKLGPCADVKNDTKIEVSPNQVKAGKTITFKMDGEAVKQAIASGWVKTSVAVVVGPRNFTRNVTPTTIAVGDAKFDFAVSSWAPAGNYTVTWGGVKATFVVDCNSDTTADAAAP